MSEFLAGWGGIALGAALVVVAAIATAVAVFRTSRLEGSSLFNRFFVLVAAASGFFSAVSSAIGFSLITSQETDDFFRNAVLPPAFGVFVFFLALAVWVGGAELVRHRDWFRGARPGLGSDALFFIERALKLFLVVPLLSVVLFVVSTWTTVVGLGGVDAVRYVYAGEVKRLQADCRALVQWRQRDLVIRDELALAADQVRRASAAEAAGGLQSGAAGEGAVAGYIAGVARWYGDLARSVDAIVAAPDPTGLSPRDASLCDARANALAARLAGDPYTNYDAWARGFEAEFNAFAGALDGWRRDKRVETFLEQQLGAYNRANPKPAAAGATQNRAIRSFDADVTKSLKDLLGDLRERRNLPPAPVKAASEINPERGLAALARWFAPEDDAKPVKPRPRTLAIAEAERVLPLSTIGPRDAVILHADVFSDVWALGIAWDYAAYLLMLAYLFFPSAERAAGWKDRK